MAGRTKQTSGERKHNRFRLAVQVMAAALFNGYATGFLKGKIFTGATKMACVPVLNCYSCPGALGACPIGALQAVLGGNRHNFSFYVLGLIMLFGIVLGRLICGFLCPFGLFQDLIHKVPLPKLKIAAMIDKPLRFLKYIVLVLFVFLFPILLSNQFGIASPFFCKLICPAGILEGALPLVAMNESLRASLGLLFDWKLGVLIAIVVLSMLIQRPFCKYLCPLGAIYGLFNRFALYQMHLNTEKCVGCKRCEDICPMNVEVTRGINSAECIRCGKCKAVCPTDAISVCFGAERAQHNKSAQTKLQESIATRPTALIAEDGINSLLQK